MATLYLVAYLAVLYFAHVAQVSDKVRKGRRGEIDFAAAAVAAAAGERHIVLLLLLLLLLLRLLLPAVAYTVR